MNEAPLPEDRGTRPEAPLSGVGELRRHALALGFGAIVLALFVLLVVIYAPVIRPLLWASALATLSYPVHRTILGWVRGRAALAAFLSTVLTLAIFALPLALLVNTFLVEVNTLWPSVREYLGEDSFRRVAAWLEGSRLRPVASWIFPDQMSLGAQGIEAALREAVSGLGELAQTQLMAIGRNAPGTAIGIAVTVLTYFFFLRHGPGWLRLLEAGLPLEPEHAKSLLKIAGDTINAVFRGVLITAAIQAALAGGAFWFVGVPAPVLLSLITFIAALIPFVGPVAVWLPAAIALLITGRVGAGIGLMIWGALVVSLVDNFLRPYLIGREVKLPVLWLFLAILGGLRAFGFLGLLLGPAALALFLACYRIYTEGRRT